MKTPSPPHLSRWAFTLLEMTIVIMVLLALISTGFFVSRKMDEWKRGREASETLRQVYSAQRMFLADNPTRLVESIVAADVIPYLPPGNATALPTVKSLTDTQLGILVNVSPPVITTGSGPYDPSGSNRDSLWDVGE